MFPYNIGVFSRERITDYGWFLVVLYFCEYIFYSSILLLISPVYTGITCIFQDSDGFHAFYFSFYQPLSVSGRFALEVQWFV